MQIELQFSPLKYLESNLNFRYNQLMILKRLNCKAEIQGLTKLPAAHHFLTRTYLPSKLRTGCWL